MNKKQSPKAFESKSDQKTRTIIDSPHLPILVQTLSSTTLLNLINRVGLEESHAIALHTTNDQIKSMLDLQLWNNEPGKAEMLKVENFIPWLELWNDLGEEFVCDKLESLGQEFVVICFSKYITAVDTRVVGLDSLGLDYGDFDVIPKKGVDDVADEEQWIVLVETLNHLHAAMPDFLAAILQRCSFVRSILQEDVSEHFVAGELERDMGQERELRFEKSGYISMTDAFAFLSISRTNPVEKLLSMVQYDGLTRRYLKMPRSEVDADLAVTQVVDVDNGATLKKEDISELHKLKGLLVDLGIESTPIQIPLMLKAANSTAVSTTYLLDSTLFMLKQESEILFQKRYSEMMYLSNVLINGIGFRGTKFTEKNAAKAVRALCNLGLDFLTTKCGESTDELYFALLSAEPGIIRPFQLGLSLLNQIPVNCAQQVAEFLSSKKLVKRLNRLPWIASELESILPGTTFSSKVEKGQFEELKSDIETLSLVIDPVAEHSLNCLIDEFPVFPKIIGVEPMPHRLDQSIRFISSLNDLDVIQSYANDLQIDF